MANMFAMTRMFLLAASLSAAHGHDCPNHCHCDRLWDALYCDAVGFSVTIHYEQFVSFFVVSMVTVTCEEPNATCSGLPPLDEIGNETVIEFVNCAPSILACVRNVVPRMPLQGVHMFNTHGPMTEEHVKYLEVPALGIHFSDAVKSIPITAINSISPRLKTLVIGGNSLETTTSINIQLSFLENLYLTRNYFGTSFMYNSIEVIEQFGQSEFSTRGDENIDTNTSLSKIPEKSRTIAGSVGVMPSLRKIVIKEWYLNLSSSIFAELSYVENMELIRNNITSLHENSFKGLARLKSLYSLNCIEDISPGVFTGLEALENIRLYGDEGFLAQNITRYASLKVACLAHIALKVLRNEALTGLLHFHVILIFKNKGNMTLESHALSKLPALRIIALTNCNINSLPENLFIGSNNIEEIIIDHNFITHLPQKIFAHLFSLVHLNLSDNKIKEIPQDIFISLNKLQVLDLSHNDIYTLHELQFPDKNSMINLNLSHNRITSIISHSLKLIYERYPNINKKTSPFKSLTHLDILDLSFNQISSFYVGWQLELLHISRIDLSMNLITNIKDFDIDFADLDVEINLASNNISSVILDPRIPLTNDLPPPRSHLILDLNPIRIDCNSYGLHQRLNGLTLPKEPKYIINDFMGGRIVKNISPDHLVCDLSSFCPDGCSSCTANGFTNEIIVVCSQLPTHLPYRKSPRFPFIYFEEPSITLKLDQQPKTIEKYDIHKLNLSYTHIDYIAFKPTKSLKILDVSHNNLTRIPDELFNDKVVLYLSYNPFECECGTITKLKQYKYLVDIDQVTCSNGEKIAEIDLDKYCERSSVIAIMGSVLAAFICFVLVGKALYSHSNDIHRCILWILCRRQPTPAEILELRLEAEKEFDLFISYAHEDTQFVNNILMPKLENDYKQKVCVHTRDWVVGDLISDQIIKSVENARRTIIVLTEHFILSEWSYLEFRTAHNLSIQEGKPRVIIILLNEDVVSHEGLRKDIKSYIAINTYLTWGDPQFWIKLRNVLPKQGRLK